MLKTVLTVDGMACSMCESHINSAVRENFKIKKVTSSNKKGITEIISDFPLDEEKLKNTLESLGYRVEGISTQPYVKKSIFHK